MAGQARVRISLGTGELEVEGAEEFVKQYADSIGTLINRLEGASPQTFGVQSRAQIGPTASGTVSSGEKQEFGEGLHSLPKGASATDQILLAGSFAQAASTDNTFSTKEANDLLIGQGVKLANASQSLKNAIAAKRVFKVGKRYRLSKTGEEHVRSLAS